MIYTNDIIGYQWDVFIKSVGLGILLGGCFDVLRIIKTVFFFGKKLSYAADLIYCLWAGFLGFSFLLNENYGVLRIYILVGTAIGFSAWLFTVGRLSLGAAKLIRKTLGIFLKPFYKIFQKILKIIKKCLDKAKNNSLKVFDKHKKLLKKKVKIVYNILCLNISKAFSFCGGKAGKEPEKVESHGTEKTEKGSFSQDCSCCVRNLSSLFADFDSGEYKQ